MPEASRRSLRQATEAAGPLAHRFLADEAGACPLGVLAGASLLSMPPEALAGARVAINLGTQRATALALLELDGVAERILLCTPDLRPDHLRAALVAAEIDAVVTDDPMAELPDGVACVRAGVATAGAERGLPRRDHDPVLGRDTEWVLFTSGTTGPPKMAVHRLSALTGAMRHRPAVPTGDAASQVSTSQVSTSQVSASQVWATFYDIRRYGGLQILLRALIGGGSMLLSAAQEGSTSFLNRAADAGISFISGTPTHWRRALLSAAATAIAPANVRLSGEVADQALLNKLRDTYPKARICHAFAATEAGVAFEVCDGLAGFPADWVETGAAGSPLGDVDLIVAEGSLHVRSPRTADRYLGPSVPALRDAEGFVDTKDLVERRGARYHFVGRRDGVINVGGLKVHPEEVEQVVNRHPRVEMSRVRSKRSPIIGEVVVVDVVLSPGETLPPQVLEAEILSRCREEMATHKVPAMVRVVPSLDISAAGKLSRAG